MDAQRHFCLLLFFFVVPFHATRIGSLALLMPNKQQQKCVNDLYLGTTEKNNLMHFFSVPIRREGKMEIILSENGTQCMYAY